MDNLKYQLANLTVFQKRIISSYWTIGLHSPLDILSHKMGISKKTIYKCFHDKDVLLEHTLNWRFTEFDKGFELILNKHLSPVNELKEMTFYWEQFIFKNYIKNNLRCVLSPSVYEKSKQVYLRLLHGNLEVNIKNGINQGVFIITNIEPTAKFYSMSLEYLKENWIENETSRRTWLNHLIEYHLNSLCHNINISL